jgi:multicomponent K+:H+ antiporter subunit D
MSSTLAHLLVIPIVLPLLAAALLLLLGERRPRLRSIVNTGATLAGLVVALAILQRVDAGGAPGTVGVYLAANWPSPFGIVLVADRLAALMLVLTGVVSLGATLYSTAGWSRAGIYFYPLFQIQLMGINGAFLTGDLFNLFVFFEVMLAASYGLQLHGSGWPRVHSGLHYIAVNLLASSLFLAGLAVLYGIMGTLSMADIAAKLPLVPASERGLLHAGAALLAMALLTKAAMWPLGFWLVPAYTAASAPVAALFALMTKVGVYTLLRLSTLLDSSTSGPADRFGEAVFLYGGLATLAFAVLGLMASLQLGRLAAFSLIASSGTLLTAIGFGNAPVTAAALYYLVSATLGASALFLLVELVERADAGSRARLRDVELEPGEDTNLDDEEEALVGRVIPVSLALLGLAFIACVLLVAGLPPLSGFVAKLALMNELVGLAVRGAASESTQAAWWFFGLLLVSALAASVALARAGIQHFWSLDDRLERPLRVVEGLPVLALLVASTWLALRADSVLRYTRATAEALYEPSAYIDTVLSAKAVPAPARTSRAGEP